MAVGCLTRGAGCKSGRDSARLTRCAAARARAAVLGALLRLLVFSSRAGNVVLRRRMLGARLAAARSVCQASPRGLFIRAGDVPLTCVEINQ